MKWDELFYVKNDVLYRKVDRGGQNKDEPAGYLNKTCGYLYTKVNKKAVLNHRIIWEMQRGEIPKGMQVDHINHNIYDNSIKNLRLVKQIDNGRNRSLNNNNSSGICGVFFHKASKKWAARIKVNYKQINLGTFETKEDAIKARVDANSKYGFHKNHGDASNGY